MDNQRRLAAALAELLSRNSQRGSPSPPPFPRTPFSPCYLLPALTRKKEIQKLWLLWGHAFFRCFSFLLRSLSFFFKTSFLHLEILPFRFDSLNCTTSRSFICPCRALQASGELIQYGHHENHVLRCGTDHDGIDASR